MSDRQDLLNIVADNLQQGRTWVVLNAMESTPPGFPRGRPVKDDNGKEVRIYRPSQPLIWIEKQDKRSLRQAIKMGAANA